MADRPYNVLFLCTGNSARSILAESLLNHWGHGRFRAYSAGSFPRGQVHPLSIALLTEIRLPTAGLRSKSWDEFAAPGAPPIDFIFTVCDDAAGEVCPVWPGHPMSAHWGVEDPAAVEGTDDEKRAAFRRVLLELENRIKLFINLPVATLDRIALQRHIEAIGRPADASYTAAVLEAYEGEVAGAAYFDALATVYPQKAAFFNRCAALERATASRLEELIHKYHLKPQPQAALAERGRRDTRAQGDRHWLELMQQSISAYPRYVDEFRALEAIGPAEDQPVLAVLTAHEVQLIAWLREQVAAAAGDG
jgi:arsenate reductase (thioredoxin)